MFKPSMRARAVPATPALVLVLLAMSALVVGCAAPRSEGSGWQAPEASVAGPAVAEAATEPVTAVVIKSPTCGCCGGHEEHMRQAGLAVTSVPQEDMSTVKDRYGVPAAMRSCHTTDIAGYFVEGHVPMAAIDQLLAERPEIDGIALPGMPPGSPGMGGVQEGPLVVFAVRGGEVIGEFGAY